MDLSFERKDLFCPHLVSLSETTLSPLLCIYFLVYLHCWARFLGVLFAACSVGWCLLRTRPGNSQIRKFQELSGFQAFSLSILWHHVLYFSPFPSEIGSWSWIWRKTKVIRVSVKGILLQSASLSLAPFLHKQACVFMQLGEAGVAVEAYLAELLRAENIL